MKLRKLIFWFHLAAGVVAGLVVLVMSVTGVLLAYERQLLEWADRGLRAAPTTGDASHLSVETLLGKVREANPNATPSTISLRADRDAPVAVGFGRERTVFVNPYTGAVLGEGSKPWRQFFHVVTDWHRWLGAQTDNRAAGRAVTGACNLGFLFLVGSGFFLWWPRKWTTTALKSVTSFERGLRGKARDWNWHNVIGFWSAVPLFFIVVTGVLISYPWATSLLYRLTGSEPPPSRGMETSRNAENKRSDTPRGDGPRSGGSTITSQAPLELTPDGLESLLVRAQRENPGWRNLNIRLPTSTGAPLTFIVEQGHRGRPDKRSMVNFDAKTGEIVSHETFASYNLGRRLRSWARWVHTGEAGGFLGQTIAFIASAGAAVLVWTGLALSLRRFLNWRYPSEPNNRHLTGGRGNRNGLNEPVPADSVATHHGTLSPHRRRSSRP